jgi:hypothetical protein
VSRWTANFIEYKDSRVANAPKRTSRPHNDGDAAGILYVYRDASQISLGLGRRLLIDMLALTRVAALGKVGAAMSEPVSTGIGALRPSCGRQSSRLHGPELTPRYRPSVRSVAVPGGSRMALRSG